ncbi:probable peptidyl-prolyl cis-trans isomerase B [Arthrobacter sp. Hiyo4]|nr:probable peptidyl-prolyl cis-trans isomerase B [Arthrobacter sp. Hiyo4]
MAASSRSAREAKRRIQQMEAKRELRRDQEKRRKRDNLIAACAGTAAVLLAVVLQFTAFAGNPTEQEFAAAEAGLTSPTDSPTASPPVTNGPNIPAPDTAAGKVFTGELALNGNVLGVEIDGAKAPQAAAVFKALTDEGFYNGSECHRLTTGEMFGLLQCGGATAAADPVTPGDPSKTPRQTTPTLRAPLR